MAPTYYLWLFGGGGLGALLAIFAIMSLKILRDSPRYFVYWLAAIPLVLASNFVAFVLFVILSRLSTKGPEGAGILISFAMPIPIAIGIPSLSSLAFVAWYPPIIADANAATRLNRYGVLLAATTIGACAGLAWYNWKSIRL